MLIIFAPCFRSIRLTLQKPLNRRGKNNRISKKQLINASVNSLEKESVWGNGL